MGSGSGVSCSIGVSTVLSPEEQALYQDPDEIRRLLDQSRTIAVVGLSADPQKASSFVASYLKYAGYRIIPVNPRYTEILGEKCHSDLADITDPVDIVDIFRPEGDCDDIVQEAIAIRAGAVWMQLRIVNLHAAETARKAGLRVVVDKCIKMEHGRYAGTLHWAGMNTGIISARKR
jgi:predicted CoA-binding protein